METSALNYERIARAIEFIKENFKEQPDLDRVAAEVNLSPYHFQKLFTEWAGVSPKKFLQYLSVNYAKGILKTKQANLFDAAYETGLSGTGRLHDMFVNIEAMTPGEFKNEGADLTIHYAIHETLFGDALVASTAKGVCRMAFLNEKEDVIQSLKNAYRNARFVERSDEHHKKALSIFNSDAAELTEIKLHLKGTPFQLKVWEALLQIPTGKLSSYHEVAKTVGSEGASRAVGTAVGENPVAFLIPCHRVIRSDGSYGEYRWGSTRKNLIIGWEGAATARATATEES